MNLDFKDFCNLSPLPTLIFNSDLSLLAFSDSIKNCLDHSDSIASISHYLKSPEEDLVVSFNSKRFHLRTKSQKVQGNQIYIVTLLEVDPEKEILQTVIGESLDVVVVKNWDGNFIFANETVARLYNTTPSEMIGREDSYFTGNKEQAEFFKQNIQGIMASGKQEIVFEDSTNAETGEVRHFKSIKTPYLNKDGEKEIVVIAQDVTDVIRLQKSATENEKLISTLYDVSSDLIAVMTPDGVFKDLNPTWKELLGYESKDIIGKSLFDFIEYDDILNTRQEFEKIKTLKSVKLLENNFKNSQGKSHIISWGMSYDEEADLVFAIGRDITADKETERENNYILETMDVGIFKWDIINDVLEWNDSNYRVFGVSRHEFSGAYDAWESTLNPDSKAGAIQDLSDALEGKREFNTTFSVLMKDGTEKFVGGRGKITRNKAGHPIYMIGVNWDRTAEVLLQKKLEEQVKIGYHQARLASIGELATGVGHEINNPLAIASGYIHKIKRELAKKNSIDIDELTSTLSKIETANERIARIVTGLKTFSRSDVENITYFNICDALTESVKMVGDIYLNDGITVVSDSEQNHDKVACLNGNRGRIQQVFMNLLSNARDAVEKTDIKKIEVKCNLIGSKIKIYVRDTGPGIPKDLQEKIFDPFFTTKDVNKGTGIGLSICHSIIKEHGGEIHVQSSSSGTEFCIVLDVDSDCKDQSCCDESSDSLSEATYENEFSGKVLVVDDEDGIRFLIEDVLKDFGFNVVSAKDGQEAIELLEEKVHTFSLIVSDMKMPRVDGPSLAKFIRESSEDYKDIPIIFMTGGVQEDLDNPENPATSTYSRLFL